MTKNGNQDHMTELSMWVLEYIKTLRHINILAYQRSKKIS